MFTNRNGKAHCVQCAKDWKIRRVKKLKTRSKNWSRRLNARFVNGKRLQPESLAVKVGGFGIDDYVSLALDKSLEKIGHIKLNQREEKIAG